jgi:hypothetical protein
MKRKTVERELKSMMKNGIIRPSQSLWAALLYNTRKMAPYASALTIAE